MSHRKCPFPVSAALIAAALATLCGCGNPTDALETRGAALQVCAGGSTVPGIDVSVYQDSIDWPRVKGAGVRFAVARVSNGTQIRDTFFDANWAGIKAAGLIRGAYQYFEPGQDAAAEADLVVSKVGRLGPGDLPVQLDMEVTGGKSGAVIADQMRIWIDRVTAGTGKRPLIYSGKYFWDDNVGSAAFNSYPLWVAAYGVSCPNLPTAWSNWTIWQHSDAGRVAGIDGNVDLDWFNGTMDDLGRLAGGGADYAAAYVSQSFPLATQGMTMRAGESVAAFIELRNTGTKAWNTNTHLGTSAPRDRVSAFAAADWLSPSRPVGVTGTVAPGATYRFSFSLHAPATPGKYPEHFNLVQEGVTWFSDVAQGGPPDDQLQNLITVIDGPATGDGGTDAASAGDAGAPMGGDGGRDAAANDAGSPTGGDAGRDAAPPGDAGSPGARADGPAEAAVPEPVTDAAARDGETDAVSTGGQLARADGGQSHVAATGPVDAGCGCASAPAAGRDRPLSFAIAVALLAWRSRRRRTCAPTKEKNECPHRR